MYSRFQGVLRVFRALWPWPHIFIFIFILAILAISFFSSDLLVVDSGDVQGNVIVVLGGASEGRAERAAELFKLGEAPKVLVSGFGDTEAYSAILEQNGVPASAIWVEKDSKSTLQNAEFSKPLFQKLGRSG